MYNQNTGQPPVPQAPPQAAPAPPEIAPQGASMAPQGGGINPLVLALLSKSMGAGAGGGGAMGGIMGGGAGSPNPLENNPNTGFASPMGANPGAIGGIMGAGLAGAGQASPPVTGGNIIGQLGRFRGSIQQPPGAPGSGSIAGGNADSPNSY